MSEYENTPIHIVNNDSNEPEELRSNYMTSFKHGEMTFHFPGKKPSACIEEMFQKLYDLEIFEVDYLFGVFTRYHQSFQIDWPEMEKNL